MPYIKEEDRIRVLEENAEIQNAGELNYLISLLCRDYITTNGLNYDNMNYIVGVLDKIKVEFVLHQCIPIECKITGRLEEKIFELVSSYLENANNSKGFIDLIGALSNAKDEFRRRIQHPYEDQKIIQNGDMYHSINSRW